MKEKLLAQLTIPGGETIEDPTGFSGIAFGDIVSWAISVLFFIGAIGALVYLVIGGIRWIMSGGDAEKLTQARMTIIYAVVGLIIIALAFFVVKFIGDLLGIPFFDFSASGSA